MNPKTKNYLKVRNKFKYFIYLCAYFLLYPLAKILYGGKRNWLVCERGFDAQDNGYFFFRFLNVMHPEINSTYLIKSNSPDYKKVKSYGKVVEFGCLKHFIMAIGCPVKISSHLFGYAPWRQMSLYFRRNKTHDIHVFLQHGIIKNEHEGLHGNVCKSLDLFVCGAKPEYEFIKNTFEYENNVPVYTGLSRYDNLDFFQTRNQILFMPTWRRNLCNLSSQEFIESKFYKNWSSLLKSITINRLCCDNNLVINFYLHTSLQKFSSLFVGNQNVKIVEFGQEDVQTLLKESKLLVTDYSSVYFDFAYMQKPIIFYQFDEDQFFKDHYSKGYFDYRKDGFGEVCTNIESFIRAFNKIINNNFVMEEKYLQKVGENFVHRDQNNSARIFDLIKEKLY